MSGRWVGGGDIDEHDRREHATVDVPRTAPRGAEGIAGKRTLIGAPTTSSHTQPGQRNLAHNTYGASASSRTRATAASDAAPSVVAAARAPSPPAASPISIASWAPLPPAFDDGGDVLAAIDLRAQAARGRFAGARARVRTTATAHAQSARDDAAHAAESIEAIGASFSSALAHRAREQGARMCETARTSAEAVRVSATNAQTALTVASQTAEAAVPDADDEERASIREELADARRGAVEKLSETTESGTNQLGVDALGGASAMFAAAGALWQKVEPGLTEAAAAAREAGSAVAAQIEQRAATNVAAIDAAERDAVAGIDRAKHGAAAAFTCRPGQTAPSAATLAQHRRGLGALDELVQAVSGSLAEAITTFTAECEQSTLGARATYSLAEGQLRAQLLPQGAAAATGWSATADQFIEGVHAFAGDAIAGHAALATEAPQAFRELAEQRLEEMRRSWWSGAWAHVKSAGWGLLQFAAVVLIGAAFIAIDLAGLPFEVVIGLALACAGLAYLTVGLFRSILARSKQADAASDGLPWYRVLEVHLRATVAAAGDAFMVSPAIESSLGRDLVSGEKLSAYERGGRFADSAIGLGTTAAVHVGMSRVGAPAISEEVPGLQADRAPEIPERPITPRESTPLERAPESPRQIAKPATELAPSPALRMQLAEQLGSIPIVKRSPGVVPADAGNADAATALHRDTYYVSDVDAARMLQLFEQWGPDVQVRNYARGFIVRRAGAEWYFERLSATALEEYKSVLETVRGGRASRDTAHANDRATEPGADMGLPAPNAATIEVWGFRGLRSIDGRGPSGWTEAERAEMRRETSEQPLLYAGHVGISFDGGETIYGWVPETGSDAPAIVMENLKANRAYPGKLENHTAVFRLAERLATQSHWDTQPISAAELVDPAVKQQALGEVQRIEGGGQHDLGYSFPLKVPDASGGDFQASNGFPAEKIANCAVFPSILGVAIPEASGNLRTYMPELQAWSTAPAPVDARSTSDGGSAR